MQFFESDAPFTFYFFLNSLQNETSYTYCKIVLCFQSDNTKLYIDIQVFSSIFQVIYDCFEWSINGRILLPSVSGS